MNYALIIYNDLNFAVDFVVYVANRKVFLSVGGTLCNLVDDTIRGEAAEAGGREKGVTSWTSRKTSLSLPQY